MSSRWEASFAVSEAQQFDITQGVASATITIDAGTEYNNLQELLDFIDDELDTQTGNTWRVELLDTSERVRISTTGGNFDWDWTGGAVTSLEVRNRLGYAADAVGQASPWTAGSAPDDVMWLTDPPQQGVELVAWEASAQSQAARTIDGTHDASSVSGARLLRKSVVVNLRRESGAWTEITDWFDFLAVIGDGRRFTIWPDDTDEDDFYDMYFAGPEEVDLVKRFDRSATYWRSTIAVNAIEA